MKSIQNLMTKLKQDKGVGGLNILLSVIISLFVIGVLIMVFSLMGGSIMSSLSTSVANNATAVKTINDTTVAISGVTSYYSIIIIITVMVVLILLTVLIIGAIRGAQGSVGA